MQTRLYDSAEPGPPHGWLDMGTPPQAPDLNAWDEIIPWVLRGEPRAKEGATAASSLQFWGGLRWKEQWWIYRLLPAGLDRHGRPGRTLTALFCATDKQGFEWQTVGSVADELEALAKDPRHLSAVQRLLYQARADKTLTDDFLKKPQITFPEPPSLHYSAWWQVCRKASTSASRPVRRGSSRTAPARILPRLRRLRQQHRPRQRSPSQQSPSTKAIRPLL